MLIPLAVDADGVYKVGGDEGATTLCRLDGILSGIFEKVWPIVGILLLGMIIYGGAMWMMSTGDPQKISKATSTLLWAFIGVAILVLAMFIMGTLEEILGLNMGYFKGLSICP